jgi:acyl-CoA synthetase (AMP-forming)/AMP-acid ligase II
MRPAHPDKAAWSAYGSLARVFRARAEAQPRARAYVFLESGETEGAALTYEDLDRKSRAIAAALQESVAAGGRALLVYPAGLDFIAGFVGCLYAGVLAVPAYPPHPARLEKTLPRLRAIAEDAGIAVVLCTGAIASMWPALAKGSPDLARIRVLATDGIDPSLGEAWRERPTTPDTLAFLQYTSGSTAAPKGVMVSHGNLLHNLAHLDELAGNDADSCGVSWLPAYHDMGLIEGILLPAFGGYRAHLMAPVAFLQEPLRWLRAISRYRATNSGGPNFAYELCVRKISREQRERLDLACWRVAYNGAEPVRGTTLASFAGAFADCGFRPEAFRPGYGLAEATLLVAINPPLTRPTTLTFDAAALAADRAVEASPSSDAAVTLVASGLPACESSIAIAHPRDLVRLPSGQVGEIWVAGPSVAQGYWRLPDETGRVFGAYLADTGEGPYLRTGDLGFFWQNELFVAGRMKDTIIVRGRKLYPQDIEFTVEGAHRAIRPGCSAAFSVTDGEAERLVIAAEVDARATGGSAETQAQDLRDVINGVREAVSDFHEVRVHAVILLAPGSLPKTSSGKLQRFACRASLLEGNLNALARWVQEPELQA